MTITGRDLIEAGFKPGPWFPAALAAANAAPDGADRLAIAAGHAPPPPLGLRTAGALAHHMNITAETDGDAANIAAVDRHMTELMRVPTVRAGAVMPDACPSDVRLGYIPVGGVVATENAIHPGMHSADICCSMAVTTFPKGDATAMLDAGMALSHFGGGGRPRGQQWTPPAYVMA